MPDYWVSNMTNSEYYAPGFLNLFDVGVRLVLRPVLVYAEVGHTGPKGMKQWKR